MIDGALAKRLPVFFSNRISVELGSAWSPLKHFTLISNWMLDCGEVCIFNSPFKLSLVHLVLVNNQLQVIDFVLKLLYSLFPNVGSNIALFICLHKPISKYLSLWFKVLKFLLIVFPLSYKNFDTSSHIFVAYQKFFRFLFVLLNLWSTWHLPWKS